MIFTKQYLVEAVIRETTIDDVMGTKWHLDANQEADRTMENEFYAYYTEDFWQAIEKQLGEFRQSPESIEYWIRDTNEFGDEYIPRVINIIRRISVDKLRYFFSNKEIYKTMKEMNLNYTSLADMQELAEWGLLTFIKYYITYL